MSSFLFLIVITVVPRDIEKNTSNANRQNEKRLHQNKGNQLRNEIQLLQSMFCVFSEMIFDKTRADDEKNGDGESRCSEYVNNILIYFTFMKNKSYYLIIRSIN